MRAPASTSNLGAGFDCVGLAFDLHLTASFEPAQGGALRVERRGTLAALESISTADDALIVGLRAALGASPNESVAGTLIVDSSIPIARGLGSSAAALVAGLLLGRAARGDLVSGEDARADLLREATLREGHPDNAAPALFGGLVAVTRRLDGSPRALRCALSPEIAFVFAAPESTVSTAAARAALPAGIDHAAAVNSVHRTAALLRGLESADAELLRIGFTDELHVPYRLPLIPGAREAIAAAVDAGAWAATISGSGSGLIAVCAHESAERVRAALHGTLATERDAIAFLCVPDLAGAVLLSDEDATTPEELAG